jgi:hypothetical protein
MYGQLRQEPKAKGRVQTHFFPQAFKDVFKKGVRSQLKEPMRRKLQAFQGKYINTLRRRSRFIQPSY